MPCAVAHSCSTALGIHVQFMLNVLIYCSYFFLSLYLYRDNGKKTPEFSKKENKMFNLISLSLVQYTWGDILIIQLNKNDGFSFPRLHMILD